MDILFVKGVFECLGVLFRDRVFVQCVQVWNLVYVVVGLGLYVYCCYFFFVYFRIRNVVDQKWNIIICVFNCNVFSYLNFVLYFMILCDVEFEGMYFLRIEGFGYKNKYLFV